MAVGRYRCPLDCKVFVGNLSPSATRHELECVFRRFGRVRDIWLATSPPGFAFVMFEHSSDAKCAVRALNDTRICGRLVTVEMSTGKTRSDRGYSGGHAGRPYRYDHYRRRESDDRYRHDERRHDYYGSSGQSRGRSKSRSRSSSRSPTPKRFDRNERVYSSHSPVDRRFDHN